MDILSHLGLAWLILAIALALVELAIPGVFVIFIALAAAITGVTHLLFPALGLAGDLVSFAAWSVVCVAIGKRWYGNETVESSDPLLNDRAGRMIGQNVTILEWYVDGTGRARVGDGVWPARGAGLSPGMSARIEGVENGTLILSPLPMLDHGA